MQDAVPEAVADDGLRVAVDDQQLAACVEIKFRARVPRRRRDVLS